jgi:hypothetical protein
MKRVATYVVLVGLALLAFARGTWPLALVLGAVKACLVGYEYMELRDAHPVHRVGFALAIALFAGVLLLIA